VTDTRRVTLKPLVLVGLFFVQFFSVLTFLGLPSQALAAERMKDLGLVQVWVADRAQTTRQATIKKAITEVILRLSGDRTVLQSQIVKQLKADAQRYLVSFSYKNPTSDQLAHRSMLGLSSAGLWLELRFEHRALINQMREQGISVWGDIRPRIVLWWGQTQGSMQSVLSSQSNSQLLMTLTQTARRRGIPLVVPMMDAEDTKWVSPESVLGFRASDLRKAGERYAPNATIVVGATRYGPNFWEANWQLSIGETSYWFEGQAQASEELAVMVVEQVADRLSELYSAASSQEGSGKVHLRIVDIADYQMYKNINSHLTRLSMVKQLHLARANGRLLDYVLVLDGSVQAFENALALGGKLVANKKESIESIDSTLLTPDQVQGDASEESKAAEVKRLEYYWVGP